MEQTFWTKRRIAAQILIHKLEALKWELQCRSIDTNYIRETTGKRYVRAHTVPEIRDRVIADIDAMVAKLRKRLQ